MTTIRATLSMVLGAISGVAWMLANFCVAASVIGTRRTMTDGDILPIAIWSVLAFAVVLKIIQFWDRLFGVRDEPFAWYFHVFFKERQ